MVESKRLTGKVVWFSARKGIGFTTCDQDGKEYFIHYSNIQMEGFKELISGQTVSYVLGRNNRGPQAEDVVVEAEPEVDTE